MIGKDWLNGSYALQKRFPQHQVIRGKPVLKKKAQSLSQSSWYDSNGTDLNKIMVVKANPTKIFPTVLKKYSNKDTRNITIVDNLDRTKKKVSFQSNLQLNQLSFMGEN